MIGGHNDRFNWNFLSYPQPHIISDTKDQWFCSKV
jgi:hypothetical protein